MIRQLVKALVPGSLRRRRHERTLRRRLREEPRRVVIGAGGVFEPDWIPTESHQLNLLRPASWEAFVRLDSIDALLAEHVWEHLTLREGRMAAKTCYRYLKVGGYIRVAVPDGLFPDPEFQEYIKVGGAAGGGEVGGHKVVYTYRQLREVFESAGFQTTLLEYHDEVGRFHGREWNTADGMIHRSKRFDSRGPISIILDAVKVAGRDHR
jgi:predicted SAM-dependent methyltransferase